MTNLELDARLAALRQQLLGDANQHCAAAAATAGVTGKSTALLRARKKKAAIEAEIDRYEAALRERYRQ